MRSFGIALAVAACVSHVLAAPVELDVEKPTPTIAEEKRQLLGINWFPTPPPEVEANANLEERQLLGIDGFPSRLVKPTPPIAVGESINWFPTPMPEAKREADVGNRQLLGINWFPTPMAKLAKPTPVAAAVEEPADLEERGLLGVD